MNRPSAGAWRKLQHLCGSELFGAFASAAWIRGLQRRRWRLMFAILPWMFADVCCKERVDERSIVGAMPELPKIVQSRLRQLTPETSGEHPDPNLLAAFAEHTLLERERAGVTAHLAICADCRQYLALAFTTREPEVAANAGATAAPRRHWFQAWRWVAPAAVACCIVAVALQYRVWPVSPEKNKELAAAIVFSKTAAPPPENLKMKLAPKSALARKLKAENHSIKLAEQLVPANQVNPIRQDGLSERQLDTYAVAKDAAAAAPAPVKENPPTTTIGAGREDSAVKLVPQAALEASVLRND